MGRHKRSTSMQCCSPPTPRDVSVLFYELLHCRALEDLHRCCSHSCFQDRMAACNQPPQQVDSPCLPCVKLTLPHWLTTSSSITAVTPENTDASRGHVVYPLTCPVHIFFLVHNIIWFVLSVSFSKELLLQSFPFKHTTFNFKQVHSVLAFNCVRTSAEGSW